MQVQYVTDEKGQRTAVLLDMDAYRQLLGRKPADPDLLTEMSRVELEALAAGRLAPAAQSRLDELLTQQNEGTLPTEGIAELDELLAQVDQLTLLKTRAHYTLNQIGSAL